MGIPVTIRMAREDDVPALLAIYAPYVTDTAITFEYEAPDAAEFTREDAPHPRPVPLSGRRVGERGARLCLRRTLQRARRLRLGG